jgi:hypothetical protein
MNFNNIFSLDTRVKMHLFHQIKLQNTRTAKLVQFNNFRHNLHQ